MKLALAQTNIVWEDKEKNLERLIGCLEQSGREAVDLILFPELSLTGFSMNTEKIAEKDGGFGTKQRIAALARMYGINIGIGYALRGASDRVYNCYGLFGRDGECLAEYQKIHPFSYGRESRYYTGGERIVSASLEGMTVTPFICYDLRFPELFRIAAGQSSLMAVAANWPKSREEHWRCLLRARAIENQCYIAGINRTGTGDGLEYNGHSMLIGPEGQTILELDGEEGLGIGEADPLGAAEARRRFPALKDRRQALYLVLEREKHDQIM